MLSISIVFMSILLLNPNFIATIRDRSRIYLKRGNIPGLGGDINIPFMVDKMMCSIHIIYIHKLNNINYLHL